MPTTKKTVFLSHSSRDGKRARALYQSLERRGIGCWLSSENIAPGGDWDDDIARAIDEAAGFVLLLSGSSADSERVADEVALAVSRSKPIFTVRLEEVEPAGGMSLHVGRKQRVDLIDEDGIEGHFARLVDELGKLAAEEEVGAEPRPLRSEEIVSLLRPGVAASFSDLTITEILRLPDTDAPRADREFRLLLEDLCSTVCRFVEGAEAGLATVDINQESALGDDLFADIRVQPRGKPAYFVEVDFGYSSEDIVTGVRRKYGRDRRSLAKASKLVLAVDRAEHADWPATEGQIERVLAGRLELEVWDVERLKSMIARLFGVEVPDISMEHAAELTRLLHEAQGRWAFGDGWQGDGRQSKLLWHLGFWKIHKLRRGSTDGALGLRPGKLENVVTLVADVVGFTGYVRDTPSAQAVRDAVMTYYAKARHELLNAGGNLYQFQGDRVIGLFGVPDQVGGYLKSSLRAARALVDLGESVTHRWQRFVDRRQAGHGLRVGIAVGPVDVVPMAPFAQARVGAVSDSVLLAGQLAKHGGPGGIVVSNRFHGMLDRRTRGYFQEMETDLGAYLLAPY